jgi:UDP-glucuronate 4-epimerase
VRVVVTGGVGFIGFHTCRALLDRGDDVVIVDHFGQGLTPLEWKERNLRDLGNVALVKASITDRDAIDSAFANADAVIHLAGVAGVRASVEDPAKYARVNVEGTTNVLEAARKHGVGRVVMASSSSVYGNDTPLPASEDAPAIAPASPYAASKRAAELVASSLAKDGFTVTALRFFTVYGPRGRPDMAVLRFVEAGVLGKTITLHGDGHTIRDFTHVGDTVRGIFAALERAPAGFRVYNLGPGKPVSLTELLKLVEEIVGRPLVIDRVPEPPGNAEATHADSSRAKRELGWEARISLREGLATVRDWIGGATRGSKGAKAPF